jgi:Protein of unknown function (DUF3127).
MSLEITGRLIQKLPMQSGTSARTGSTWQKQEFVIETNDQFPRKICANLWGDRADQLNEYNIGDQMKVSFDLESREFNGKWYTDVKAWKIEHVQEGAPQQGAYNPAGAPPQHTAYTPPAGAPQPASDLPGAAFASDTFVDNGTPDDLPF